MSDSITPAALPAPVWGAVGGAQHSGTKRHLHSFGKRAIDITLALTLIVLLSPIMTMIALLIRMKIGSTVIYAHRRVGRHGLPFYCFKFRTMVPMPEGAFAAYLASHPEAAEEWRQMRKLKQDPRVTQFGRLLRESSLDELPQLFNVLRGEMSFVGPRPVVYDELEHYGSATLDYLSLRPGLTGLWQVSGRSTVSYAERVSFDRYYIREWSVFFDLYILLRTIPAVLRRTQTA